MPQVYCIKCRSKVEIGNHQNVTLKNKRLLLPAQVTS